MVTQQIRETYHTTASFAVIRVSNTFTLSHSAKHKPIDDDCGLPLTRVSPLVIGAQCAVVKLEAGSNVRHPSRSSSLSFKRSCAGRNHALPHLADRMARC